MKVHKGGEQEPPYQLGRIMPILRLGLWRPHHRNDSSHPLWAHAKCQAGARPCLHDPIHPPRWALSLSRWVDTWISPSALSASYHRFSSLKNWSHGTIRPLHEEPGSAQHRGCPPQECLIVVSQHQDPVSSKNVPSKADQRVRFNMFFEVLYIIIL